MTPTPKLLSLAEQAAKVFSLDPSLVKAVVENESSWNPNAIRFEERFYTHYTEPMNLPESEELQRACSYGLMQILGETAREQGFHEDFMVLYDPEVNLHLGCQKLRRCLDLHRGNVREGLLAYNGGADLGYPDRVLVRQPKYWHIESHIEEHALGG